MQALPLASRQRFELATQRQVPQPQAAGFGKCGLYFGVPLAYFQPIAQRPEGSVHQLVHGATVQGYLTGQGLVRAEVSRGQRLVLAAALTAGRLLVQVHHLAGPVHPNHRLPRRNRAAHAYGFQKAHAGFRVGHQAVHHHVNLAFATRQRWPIAFQPLDLAVDCNSRKPGLHELLPHPGAPQGQRGQHQTAGVWMDAGDLALYLIGRIAATKTAAFEAVHLSFFQHDLRQDPI